MYQPYQTVNDLVAQADALRTRRYGMIEVVDGRLVRVQLRPFPKIISLLGVLLQGRWFHRRAVGNRCRLYYNQPRHLPAFLALTYVVSSRDCTMATARMALSVLDEIARLKETDAIVADASNGRITEGIMVRYGWEAHCPSRWHRNFIKRFYGAYPAPLSDC